MFVKDFKELISIDCQTDESGNSPVVLELKNKKLWLTYMWVGGVLTKKQIQWDEEGEWHFATTLGRLKEAIGKNSRNAAQITIAVADDQTLAIKTLIKTEKGDRKSDHQVMSWGVKPQLDLDTFEADSQSLVLDMEAWAEIRQAGNVIVRDLVKNEKESREILSSYVRLDIWAKTGFATGYSPGMISYRQFACTENFTKARVYLVPVTLIALIGTLKLEIPVVTLRLSADKKQLLTTVDDQFFLTNIPSEDKYPILDGVLQESAQNSLVAIDDKTSLQAALQAAKDAGVKNITLSFSDQEVTVDAGKKLPKISIPVDSRNKFTSTVKLSVNLILDALNSINVTKILLLFPALAGKALIIETLTGVVYLILAITKVTAHIIESIKDTPPAENNSKPKPRTKQLEIGKTHDGKAFALVAVEDNPLAPLKGETPEQRLLEAQSQGDEILAKLKKNQEEIILEDALIDATLANLEANLREALQESQKPVLSDSEEYRFQELEAMSLKLYWTGGRILNILLHKDPEWKLEIRMINPTSK
ncbi:MAG: hypothetical protein V7L05_03990 [Nostoc sp.]|uniref:hypothetical protein n=1 Tax=Nostoc sp. TaxID=1180 RepID=UPI002FF9AE55